MFVREDFKKETHKQRWWLQRFCNRNLFKYVWGDQIPLMTKHLSKDIMKRSRLPNNFLRNRVKDNRSFYKRHINLCLSLPGKSKKKYNKILNVKKITDNKVFWKTIKPLLWDKSCVRDRISIRENSEIFKTESETAETLNDYFSNITKNLNISWHSEFDSFTEIITEPTLKDIEKYKDQASILGI